MTGSGWRGPVKPVVVLAACLVLLEACGAEQAVDAPSTQEARGDTVVVRNRRPLLPDTVTPVETARYGRFDGPVEYIFSDVLSFAVAPDGDVFVHDRDDGIRRFRRDGTFAGRIARVGKGPSEVGYLLGMDVDDRGRLAAMDLGNGRISIFGLTDGSVSTIRRPPLRPRYGDGSIRFHTDGSLWIGIHPPVPESGGLRHPRAAFLRVEDDGSFPDTVFTPANAASECTTLSDRRHRVGYWEDRREPFVPKATWALGPDGSFAVGCPIRYIFELRPVSGGVLRVEKSSWTPLTMLPDERKGLARQGGMSVLPAERPAYARLILPGDGRTWVWPNQPGELVELDADLAERFGQTHAWRIPWGGAFDVFSESGEWLAVVRLPQEARFSGFPTERSVFIRGDTIWALAQNEFDAQTIVRYEVPGLSD
jgi:hypothetical protein